MVVWSALVGAYDDLLTSGVYGPWTHADFISTASASLVAASPDNWTDPINYSLGQGAGSGVTGPAIGDGDSVTYIPIVAEAAARLDALSAAWGVATPDWASYNVGGQNPSPGEHISIGDMVNVILQIRAVSTYWFPGGAILTVPIDAPWLDFAAGSNPSIITGQYDGTNLVAQPGIGGGGDTTGYTIGLQGQVISTAADDLKLTLGPGNGHSGSLFVVQAALMDWVPSFVPPPPPPGYVPPGPFPGPNDLAGAPGPRRLQFDERF